MGILKNLAKDLLVDSIADNIASASLKHGKKIAAGAGIAAAAGLTGAMLGRKAAQSTMAPAAQVPDDVPPLPAPALSTAVPSLPVGPPAPPAFSFYAIIEGKQRGPYDEIQFKRLVENDLANASTLVWKEGMSDWLPAGEVKMMASIFPQQQQQPQAVAAPAMPQMPQRAYYVNLNNQQVGPFNLQQLQYFAQTGEFTQQMFVWCEGMPQWLAAGAVPELASLFGPAMPQMPNV